MEFSQAELTEPFHWATLLLSENVQRPVMSASKFCSTQLSVVLFAVLPELLQVEPELRQRFMEDSELPFNSASK